MTLFVDGDAAKTVGSAVFVASVEQPFDRERGERGGGDEREQVRRCGDPLELCAAVAHLDVADRADGHSTASTPARALVAGAGAAASAEPETRLGNGNHGYTLALDGLAKDRRHLRPFANRLSDPL